MRFRDFVDRVRAACGPITWIFVAAIAFTAVAGTSSANAQYSLGTATTPFTTPGQTITLSYILGNQTSSDVTVSANLKGVLGNPSCTSPVIVAASTNKTCTFTYATSLTDVAANAISVTSQWSFCDAACNSIYTDNNILTVRYQGAPVINGASQLVPFASTGTAIDLSSHVTGAVLYLSVASPPAHGSVSVSGQTATYTPASGFYGADSYSFTATGPNGTSAPAVVAVSVALPPAPTISGSTLTVAYNSPGTPVDFTSKIGGVASSITIVGGPTHGSITTNGGVATYIAATGYIGPDTFSVAAVGPGGTSAPAIVSVMVLAPPAPTVTGASATIAYASQGTAIDLTAKIGGIVSTISTTGGPSHGAVSISGEMVIYTPAAGYFGPDSFAYTATGPGGTSAPAAVSLTVLPPPAPVSIGTTLVVAYNSPGTAVDLASKITGITTSVLIAMAPKHGTASLAGTVVTYVPAAGYYGADSFSFTATGVGGTSAPATVAITVDPPSAPLISGTTATVGYNSSGTPIDLTSRISGVATMLTVASKPSHGTVSVTGLVVTYVPTTGYSGTDSFTANVTGPGGTSTPATVALTVSPAPVSGATITIKVVTAGTDGSFGFVSTIPGASTFNLATSGGSASRALSNVPVGAQSIVMTGLPAGFRMTSVQCNGATSSGSTASVTVANGSIIACTFATSSFPVAPRATAAETARNFLHSRADALASAEPDTARRHARVLGSADDETPSPSPRGPVSGPGGGAGPVSAASPGAGRFANSAVNPASAPVSFSGNVQDGSGQMSFSTSLSQIRKAQRDLDDQRRLALGGPAYGPSSASQRPALFDVWVEAHASMYVDDTGGGNRRGNLNLVYLGADYLISKSILIGALVQIDQARETSASLGTSASGTGWMAGPYVTARLSKNVLLDARAAWGQSSNQVSTSPAFADQFATSRSLLNAKLSGNWHSGELRISPSLDVTYYQENQRAFTSASGDSVGAQTVSLGRMSVGPEFGTRIRTDDGIFEPYVSLKALWDFRRDATVSIGGMDVGTDAIRGKIEAGAAYTTSSGVAIKGAASYDGLGDRNFHAIEGKLSVNVPLH